ncbi:MAG: hypothetical protein LBL98_07975 [Ruminococcus sp.]|jgi:hypothetical protein|nr:hypothetical protein [Ruminococcus sp.]
MKKEELIAKAHERGITLTELQAEKYIELSDEELENLEASGGELCPGNGFRKLVSGSEAVGCKFFDSITDNKQNIHCNNCKKVSLSTTGHSVYLIYCTCEEKWAGAK